MTDYRCINCKKYNHECIHNKIEEKDLIIFCCNGPMYAHCFDCGKYTQAFYFHCDSCNICHGCYQREDLMGGTCLKAYLLSNITSKSPGIDFFCERLNITLPDCNYNKNGTRVASEFY